MKCKLIPLVLAACSFAAVEAGAITVMNGDATTHTVTIMEVDEEQSYELAPAEALDDICMGGCTAVFPNGEEIDLEGTETIMIEGSAPVID